MGSGWYFENEEDARSREEFEQRRDAYIDELEAKNDKLEAKVLRMQKALEAVVAWEFDWMGDCVADARKLAAEALIDPCVLTFVEAKEEL